jgi:fatty-acid desaturase
MSQQVWAVNSLGGYLGSDQFSKKIRHAAQPLIRKKESLQVYAI